MAVLSNFEVSVWRQLCHKARHQFVEAIWLIEKHCMSGVFEFFERASEICFVWACRCAREPDFAEAMINVGQSIFFSTRVRFTPNVSAIRIATPTSGGVFNAVVTNCSMASLLCGLLRMARIMSAKYFFGCAWYMANVSNSAAGCGAPRAPMPSAPVERAASTSTMPERSPVPY